MTKGAWLAIIGFGVSMLLPMTAINAQPSDRIVRIEPVRQEGELHLYPAAGQKDSELWNHYMGRIIARNVTVPTIAPFLPDPAKATGAAVIIAPGGGFKHLSMKLEGWDVAKWLADRGIAAFVLKYRLNHTVVDDQKFLDERLAAARALANQTFVEPRATADAVAALRLVRANAAKWGLDPQRVGMIGFSAGAITTLQVVLNASESDRPDFIGYIYGPMQAVAAPQGAPPAFMAIAADDVLFKAEGFGIVESWRRGGSPVELHYYEKGGHGFGIGRPDTTSAAMMEQFRLWMETRQLLTQTRIASD
jgi:acetyl esterase/lipase